MNLRFHPSKLIKVASGGLARRNAKAVVAALCLAAATTANAAPTTVHAIGTGLVRPNDLECFSFNPVLPICLMDFRVTAWLSYTDPDRAVNQVLGLDAISAVTIKVFDPRGMQQSVRDFYYPANGRGDEPVVNFAAIEEAADLFTFAFSGIDGLHQYRWLLATDGSVRIDSGHGEGYEGGTGSLTWKVPEPGAALLGITALLALAAQRCTSRAAASGFLQLGR